MNPLIYIAAVGVASAGLVLRQQAAIEHVQQHIARLSGELLITRNGIETDRASLSEARSRLNRLRGELQRARHEETAAIATLASGLTPEREGWWPKDQPYFYLPKSYLPQVRFRKCRLPIAEVNDRLAKQARANNPNVISVSVQPDGEGEGSFEDRLFEGGKLNRDMAVLLGMSDTEAERTGELYAGLIRAVQEIEAARIERLDPPEPADTTVAGQITVARMADLSEDVNPLLAAANEELKELLRDSRAAVLAQQAGNYFDQYRDKLGALPREFIRDKDMLIIQYRERWGKYQSSQTVALPVSRNAEYGHLFGPGAPCELKKSP